MRLTANHLMVVTIPKGRSCLLPILILYYLINKACNSHKRYASYQPDRSIILKESHTKWNVSCTPGPRRFSEEWAISPWRLW